MGGGVVSERYLERPGQPFGAEPTADHPWVVMIYERPCTRSGRDQDIPHVHVREGVRNGLSFATSADANIYAWDLASRWFGFDHFDVQPLGPLDEAEEEYVSRCPACGDVIDYCQGHGEMGDPAGFAILAAHDDDDHSECDPDGCDEAGKAWEQHLAAEREAPKRRLEYLRQEIRAERISYAELAELADLVPLIASDDVELLEWAGVKEVNR